MNLEFIVLLILGYFLSTNFIVEKIIHFNNNDIIEIINFILLIIGMSMLSLFFGAIIYIFNIENFFLIIITCAILLNVLTFYENHIKK